MNKAAITKLFTIQVVVLVVVSVVMMFIDKQTALSVFAGGATSVIPNLYFSYRFFKHAGASKSHLIVKNFYLGETVKLVLTVLFFALAFSSGVVQPAWFFLGFGIALVLQWFAPLLVKNF
jgi:ATP synthase protein I